MDIHDLSLFRRMLCSLSPHIRTWWGILRCSPRPVLGGQASAVFLLPSAAQGRTAVEKGQLHVRPARHPRPTRVLQHLRAHDPARGRAYGSYGRAEAVQALTHAIMYVGLAADVLGRVPLMPLFLLSNSGYSDHPTPAPPAQGLQVSSSTWAGRCSR